jgi:hypothetical protein
MMGERDRGDAGESAYLRALAKIVRPGSVLLALAILLKLIHLYAPHWLGPWAQVCASIPDGLALGIAMTWVQEVLPESAMTRLAPAGLGVAVLGLMGGMHALDNHQRLLGVVWGSAIGCLWLTRAVGEVAKRTAVDAIALLAMIFCVSYLGEVAHGGSHQAIGIMLGFAALACAVIGGGIGRSFGREGPGWLGIRAVLLLAISAWVIFTRYVQSPGLAWAATLSAAAACIAVWQVTASGGSPMGFLISCVIWLGVATFAFGQDRGYGMAVAAVVGLASLVVLGNRRAVLTIGPLIGLVLYRALRELHQDVTRAFDIGQHYAILGILLAIFLVLIPLAWMAERTEERGPTRALAIALAGAITVAATLALGVFLGAKGMVGLLVGLGLAPVVSGLAAEVRTTALAWGVTLSVTLLVSFNVLSPWLNMERDDKLSLFYWVGIVLALGIVVTLALGGKARRPAHSGAQP